MKTTFRQILLSLALYDALFSLLATITFSLPCLSSHWRVWIMPLLLPYIIPGLLQSNVLQYYRSEFSCFEKSVSCL